MSPRFRFLLSIIVGLMTPAPAHAGPVVAIVAFLVTWSPLVTALVTFVATFALTAIVNALFGPKVRQQERQASILQMNIGESPREVLFGEGATGGGLVDAGNYGGDYGTDWELLILTVADHKCAGLTGFYVNDTYVAYTGDGAVAGYNGQLTVYWRDGSASQTLPSIVTNIGWSSTEDVGGAALIIVAYKADAPQQTTTVFNSRPSFLWVVKGKLCYDPRKDSTVGGSGSHRWATPSTWEWTDNLSVCRYNWVRGIYAKDQVTNPAMLLVGRGLSSLEAPEANVFAYANLCDENVALAAGGTVKRYTFNGVIRADEKYVDTERKFAECCAGVIIQPGGSVEVEPGQARSITATITDDDLCSGEEVQWSPFRSAADSAWVNTVVASYAEPTQKYQDHAAPVRRYSPDLTADGGPREQRLSLSAGVTVLNQASRVAEVVRRMGRFVGSSGIALPPRLAGITEGDWIQWTSARRFGGLTKTFRVEAYGLDEKWRNRLSLREIGAACYTWTTSDETASTAVAVPQTPPPGGWIRAYNAGLDGASAFTLVNVANMTITSPTSVTKTSGASGWNGVARTFEGGQAITAGCSVGGSGPPTSNYMMAGIDTFTTNPTNYDGFDYAIHLSVTSIYCYHKNFTPEAGPFSLGTYKRIYVRTDGSTVYYMADSTILYSRPLDAGDIGATLYGLYATSEVGYVVDGITFSNDGRLGSAGLNAKTLYVTSTFQTIGYDAAGALSPSSQTNTFVANKQNTTNTVAWTITDNKGNALTPATYLSAASGDSVTMTAASFSAALAVNGATGLTVTGTIAADSLSDKISVAKVQAGSNGTNGTNGTNAKTIVVIADRLNFTYDGTGAAAPSGQVVTFTTNKQNTTGTVDWTVTDNLGNALTPVTSFLSASTGNSVTMSEAQFAAALAAHSAASVVVTGTITADSISDKIGITKTRDGSTPSGAATGYPAGTTQTVVLDTGATTTWSAKVRYGPTTSPGTLYLQLQYSLYGSGSWSAFPTQSGSGVTGSNYGDPDPVAALVTGSFSNSSGATQTYQVRAIDSGGSGTFQDGNSYLRKDS